MRTGKGYQKPRHEKHPLLRDYLTNTALCVGYSESQWSFIRLPSSHATALLSNNINVSCGLAHIVISIIPPKSLENNLTRKWISLHFHSANGSGLLNGMKIGVFLISPVIHGQDWPFVFSQANGSCECLNCYGLARIKSL